MPGGQIDILLKLWAASLAVHGDEPPFHNHQHLYDVVDATKIGDVAWENFTLNYTGVQPDSDVPSWMDGTYEVWFRDPRQLVHNIISNPDFKDEFDYVPFHEYDGTDETNHRFHNFMSGDWAWKQAVRHFVLSFRIHSHSQLEQD